VEVEAVVARGPERADVEALEDHDLLSCALQHRGGCEAGRAGTDHEDHATVIACGDAAVCVAALEQVVASEQPAQRPAQRRPEPVAAGVAS
jgi:hypothetical protein